MISLKAFLPEIAKVVGSTPDALYSRQRKLVQMGVLPIVPGRGPGSGTTLTTETLAIFLVSLLVGDGVADLDEGVSAALNAVPNYEAKKGPYVEKDHNFLQTLDRYIESTIRNEDVFLERISVSKWETAELLLRVQDGDRKSHTEILTFNVKRSLPRPHSAITRTSSFALVSLVKIIGLLVPPASECVSGNGS